ncbi:MAG: M48 family metallopeptidase [Acidobacteriota bacterium]
MEPAGSILASPAPMAWKARPVVVWIILSLVVCAGSTLQAQTKVEPGFNLFTPEQDVEIGRQSAAEAEKQLPILHIRSVDGYVTKVGRRLAEAAPGPEFPYQFRVVNTSEINAFALPGGFMFLNRGLIEAADDEAQLAGVMAHEMAHVALRHGTNQASKAYLAQAGLSLLGSLFGRGNTSQMVTAIGGFGMNTVFLKFSREAEQQADIVGAQIMAGAGYDPMEMAHFFEKLREESGNDPSRLERFFSDHPAPVERVARVEEEVHLMGTIHATRPVGGFSRIQRRLKALPPPPKPKSN